MMPFVYRLEIEHRLLRCVYVYIYKTRKIRNSLGTSNIISVSLSLFLSLIKALHLLCACGKQKLSLYTPPSSSFLCQYTMCDGDYLYTRRVKHDFPSKGLLPLWRSNTTNRTKKKHVRIYIHIYNTHPVRVHKSYGDDFGVNKSSGVRLL